MKASPTMSRLSSAAPGHAMAHAGRGQRPIEYHLLYALVFSMCLVIAVLGRLVPARLKSWSSPRTSRPGSLLDEARAGASSTVPFVFQV